MTAVQRLAQSTYRFRDERWEVLDTVDGWVASTTLDGYGHDEGVNVIAACPWASMVEGDE